MMRSTRTRRPPTTASTTAPTTALAAVPGAVVRATLLLVLLLAGLAAANPDSYANRDFSLSPGFYDDPFQIDYTSGGTVFAGDLVDHSGYACRGYIAAEPEHVMILYKGFDYLRLFVESSEDVTLVLFNPELDLLFCDDDSYGFGQPEITLRNVPAGEWGVFVGSYSWGVEGDYTLNVTEFRPEILGR